MQGCQSGDTRPGLLQGSVSYKLVLLLMPTGIARKSLQLSKEILLINPQASHGARGRRILWRLNAQAGSEWITPIHY